MCRYLLVALIVLPAAGCTAGMADQVLKKPGAAVYGQPQAAAMWKAERENTEAGSLVDPYGLAQPRNVPAWKPLPLTSGSLAAVFEPGRPFMPVGIVLALNLTEDVPLNVVIFLERCSGADLSAPACWAKWAETPWNVGMNEGVALANP